MTREIDPRDIEGQTLTYDEAKYLRERDRLPADYPMPDNPKEDDVVDVIPLTRVTPLEEQDVPTIGNSGGIVDDEEDETYTDGWNNDQRRAELSRRELSVEGGKDKLIARLLRSDTGQLLDEDISTVD